MRFISYELMNGGIYKVIIKPGKIIGFGVSYRGAVKNALRFEAKNLFAIDELFCEKTQIKQRTLGKRYR